MPKELNGQFSDLTDKQAAILTWFSAYPEKADELSQAEQTEAINQAFDLEVSQSYVSRVLSEHGDRIGRNEGPENGDGYVVMENDARYADVEWETPYYAKVNGVEPYGVFVSLTEWEDQRNEIRGLVHKSRLPGLYSTADFAEGDEVVVGLYAHKGDEIELKMVDTIDTMRDVDFERQELPEAPEEGEEAPAEQAAREAASVADERVESGQRPQAARSGSATVARDSDASQSDVWDAVLADLETLRSEGREVTEIVRCGNFEDDRVTLTIVTEPSDG